MTVNPEAALQHAELIRELRDQVLNYDGPVEESPHYDQLARLLVSDCIIGNYPRRQN